MGSEALFKFFTGATWAWIVAAYFSHDVKWVGAEFDPAGFEVTPRLPLRNLGCGTKQAGFANQDGVPGEHGLDACD